MAARSAAATASRDWIVRHAPDDRFERIEAYFGGRGYGLHRHDTYAIGCTLAGVQSFHYRRGLRHSLPGGVLVLHPDEAHDGQAGTEAGFHYRMAYVQPALIQRILGGRPLPFVRDGISSDARLRAACAALLGDTDAMADPLREDDAIYDLTQALCAAAGQVPARPRPDYAACERARQYIHDARGQAVSLDELERAAGIDRWSLSRDFRALYGTSPYRYALLRRLDLARRLIAAGQPLAQAALAAGFTDQSHMTRRHAEAFGMTPAHWRGTLRR
ncbi:AraC family transcriptional regulator [Achromobacter xylosoxidans]|jgi:AraC-like DNA-binding protein|uniref:AraC family transcriptional regulator n=1 Tax=Alcaligenes xylosoxydans xylosoxydans TaxID=85698 RepID=UPI0006AC1021|nr:AraC family transcriptional regulator [Achromobacter xylosoxidans]AUZ18838.1 AraC family transcriptional regulator [Achromobacter xylosoxidans]KOQ19193.1 AraC family transcriptional regulator [Achromobacter xylosoxidans]KOQ43130.1 AraC family transcriptional regulator [Achromobacter xylosoxidans]KOQ44153.1 AraC family transcriptional regulator [Achromobacter xylosoxidans]KOQ58468.1 AraC family transcriptional regulator [Achromobacter xylosoxidans]